jgi:hypothetical protein
MLYITYYLFYKPVCNNLQAPVAVRSKVQVCGRSPAEIMGSNLTGDMDVCLSVVCFQVEVSATG